MKMINYFTLLILINLIFINIIICHNQLPNSTIVKITDNESNKVYIGLRKTIEDKEINYFLGIPYAEPSIGKLRFKRPVPHKYQKNIIATKWQNSCYQLIGFDPTGITQGDSKVRSEDCLYLNIWAPADTSTLKTVMVFIHGGGFIGGTNAADLLNGEMFPALSDVVLVTIAYRINVFGFLYSGTAEAPGNAALWDQVLALEWIRNNIHVFGGDPSRVTLFGESAGAWSTSLHILSPVSRHLFQNALFLSGSALTHLSGEDPKHAIKRWANFSKSMRCGNGLQMTDRAVDCPRRVSAKKLSEYFISRRDLISDFLGAVPLVVYGNQFLPNKPIHMLKMGDFKHNFNLLSGFTDNEGLLFMLMYHPHLFDPFNSISLSKEESFILLQNFTSRFKTDHLINAKDVYRLYLSQLPQNNTDLMKQSIGEAIGDFYFTCPSNLYNKYVYSADTTNNKVFQYVFSAKPETCHPWCPKSLGSCHGTDLYIFFGHPLRYSQKYSSNEKAVSKAMINTFTYFAKYGKPPAQEGVEWSSYYQIENSEDIVQPYYQFLLEPKHRGNFGFNYKEFECEKLWKTHIENQ